jgi:hypothetical protein
MSRTGIAIWIIIILILILGGGAILGYGLHKHEDKGEKTTTHKIFVGLGALLIIVGVIVSIIFIIKYRRENKGVAVIQTPAAAEVEMAEMPMKQMGYSGMNPGGMNYSGMNPGTPVYPGQMGGFDSSMYAPQMNYGPQNYPVYPGGNPMMNQWA